MCARKMSIKCMACVIIIFLIVLNYFVYNIKYATYYNDKMEKNEKTLQETFNHSQLLNLSNFQYILPNDLCQQYSKDKDLLAIIIIVSNAVNFELRAAHREAISQAKLAEMGLQRIFLLAEVPPSERLIRQQQLQSEQRFNGDLLQGNFMESYRNLSYKHIMGIRWAATYCARANFIIKLDDDTVFDVFQIRTYLVTLQIQELELVKSSNFLAGNIYRKGEPIREVYSKWFVSLAEYAKSVYPKYLSGELYITNSATAARLVDEAHLTPYFWVEDVFVTGIVRARIGIPLYGLGTWYTLKSVLIECCVRDLKKWNYECEYLVGTNDGNIKLIVEYIHNVERCSLAECVKRPPEKSLNKTCIENDILYMKNRFFFEQENIYWSLS